MYEFYCETCGRKCDYEELELREVGFGDDYEEFHIVCDTEVKKSLKLELK